VLFIGKEQSFSSKLLICTGTASLLQASLCSWYPVERPGIPPPGRDIFTKYNWYFIIPGNKKL
jgi:hypothetical protein